MISRVITRGPVTTWVMNLLNDGAEGLLIGDAAPPPMSGWQGDQSVGQTFKPYSVVLALATQTIFPDFDGGITALKFNYAVTSQGIDRAQTDAVADSLLAVFLFPDEGIRLISTPGGDFRIGTVNLEGMGGIIRDPSTTPNRFSRIDTFSLQLEGA